MPFTEVLDPEGKQVEDWMLDVENEMKKTVKEALYEAVLDYPNQERVKWIYMYPGQCALNGSQVHYTHEVEEALRNNSLNSYKEKLQKQLLDVVKLDR